MGTVLDSNIVTSWYLSFLPDFLRLAQSSLGHRCLLPFVSAAHLLDVKASQGQEKPHSASLGEMEALAHHALVAYQS